MQKDTTRLLDETISTQSDREGKYLTFTLASEDYGIGILKIKEIIGMMPITSVPQTPSFFKGVVNLRGKVIPVVDLRLKFAMPAIDYILGMAKIGGRVKILLDIDKVLSTQDLVTLEKGAL